MRSGITGFGTIVPGILSEKCEEPTYASCLRDEFIRTDGYIYDIRHRCEI